MKKKYWFYIDTYVHIAVKKSSVLFYNSYTGKLLEYPHNPEILRLTRRLLSPKNLQVIRLKEADLKNSQISKFISSIREHFMGDLIDVSLSNGKPIQTPPIVKVQKDVRYLRNEHGRSVGEEIMNYLSDVSLYITNQCDQDCTICCQAYRQFLCCTAGKTGKHELKIDHIKRLIQELKYCSLVNLNILGGDIFRYPKLERLVTLTTALQTQKNYYLHYLNAYANRNRLKNLAASDSRLKILVTFPARKEKLKLAIDAAVQSNLHFTLCFIIQGKKEFEEAEALVELFQVNKVEFFAFYNSSNTDFFKKNIYVDREDIGENRPKLKDIYTMGTVNSLDFGHLVILPNGRIYANVNKPSLGLMGKHSIYEIVLKEMKSGKSWHRIRKNVLPCKRCTFEMLCPPLSSYNIIIGKNNLCHIWQDPDLT